MPISFSNVWDLDIDIDGHSAENIQILGGQGRKFFDFFFIFHIFVLIHKHINVTLFLLGVAWWWGLERNLSLVCFGSVLLTWLHLR